MACMIDLPREGHLSVVLQILSFLKRKHNGVAAFDPTDPEIDQTQFPTKFCSETPCGPRKEDVSFNAPAPRGAGFNIRAFVRSVNFGNSAIRISRTLFIMFLDRSPIFVSSKKHGSCETSNVGSEFIAMKS